MNPTIEDFLKTKRAHNTVISYRYDLELLEETLGKPLRPELVTQTNVERHLVRLKSKAKPAGNRTLERHLAAINQYLAFYGRPILSYDLVPKWEPKPLVILSRTRVEEVLSHFEGCDRTVMELLYNGLTISEALNLTPADVSDTHISVVGRGGKRRRVPVLPRVRLWLKQFPPPYADHDRFWFIGKVEKYFGTTLQGLRHSFAVHLVQSGARRSLLKPILGANVAKKYSEFARDPQYR
jgi:site-specific recombinase XerD